MNSGLCTVVKANATYCVILCTDHNGLMVHQPLQSEYSIPGLAVDVGSHVRPPDGSSAQSSQAEGGQVAGAHPL